VAPRRPGVHALHGARRPDDYGWLRDVDDPATQEYLRAERAHYRRATAGLEALHRELEAELVRRTPDADASVTWERHGVVYFTRSDISGDHDTVHRFDPVTGGEQLVLDPNDAGGAVGSVEPGPDGVLVACTVRPPAPGVRPADAGYELRFRAVATGRELPDRVPGVRPGGAWSADGRVYLYASADGQGRSRELRAHRIGTPAVDDAVLAVEPDPRFRLDVAAARSGDWITVTARGPGSTEVLLLDARDLAVPARCVARRRPGVEYAVEPLPGGWDGAGEDLLLVVTDDGAPEFRLLEAPVPAPGQDGDPARWDPVPGLPSSGERLESALVFDRHVVLAVRRDGEPFLRVVDRPAPGTALPRRPRNREVHPGVPFGQLRLWHPDDPAAATVVLVEENLVTAPAWVAVDLATGARSVIKRTAVPGADPSAYVTERMYVTAPDGVRVPVTAAHRRDLGRGRTTGLLLTGYGAYEACSWPAFDVTTLALLDRGMAVAVAHVRGGGELGRQWWQDARGAGKVHTFVDYVAARDGLVASGWAGEMRGGARVATRGVGAGGLLQAAAYSRAPRMWRAVVAESPLVDVVGALTDPTRPGVEADRLEWGDPLAGPEELTAVTSWSPYDNPPPPGRPALLVTASMRDGRAPVHEPARWVARLHATDDAGSPSPLLLRIEPGEGTSTTGRWSRLRYEAEILAWILRQLDLA